MVLLKRDALYCVHVVKGVDDSYLHLTSKLGLYFLAGKGQVNAKYQFTSSEIVKMIDDPDLAINWVAALERTTND